MKGSILDQIDRELRREELKRAKYTITYTDPGDVEGLRSKTWGFERKRKAKDWRADLAGFWGVRLHDIPIQRHRRRRKRR